MELAIDEYNSITSTVLPRDRSTVPFYLLNRMSTQMTQELLYVTLSVVLGSSLLTLIAIMFVCAWRQRQRRRILGSFFLHCFLCITYSFLDSTRFLTFYIQLYTDMSCASVTK